MRSLIRISIIPFLKVWGVYLVLHIINGIYLRSKGPSESSVESIFSLISYFYLVFSPFVLLVTKQTFNKNIDWLRNNFYSRKQLLLFFMANQTFRLILTILPTLLCYDLLARVEDYIAKTLISTDYFWYIPLQILIVLFIGYIFPLAVSRKTKVVQKMISFSKTKNKKLMFTLIVILNFVVLLSGKFIFDSELLTEMLFIFLLSMGSAWALQERFLFVSKSTSKKVAGIITLASLILTFSAIIYSKSIIKSNEVAVAKRAQLYIHMESVAPDLMKEDLDRFFLALNSWSAREQMLDMHRPGDLSLDVLYKVYFNKRSEENEVSDLLYFLSSSKMENAQFKNLIKQMSIYIKKNEYNGRSVEFLHRVIRKVDLDDVEYIHSLYKQNTTFLNYVAFELTFHKLDKSKWDDILMEYRNQIDRKLVIRSFGKNKKIPPKYLKYLNKSSVFEHDPTGNK